MKYILVVLFIITSSAEANEVGLFYGKGVAGNPNSDYVQMRVYGVGSRYFVSLGNANGITYVSDTTFEDAKGNRIFKWEGGSQPFTSLGVGADWSRSFTGYAGVRPRMVFSLAPTILNRTLDGNGAAAILEGRLELGFQIGRSSFGLARTQMSRPRVKDDKTRLADRGQEGKPWLAPVFQGIFLRITF